MSEITKSKFGDSEVAEGFEPYSVNGFRIEQPLTTANGGNCKWGYATKFGKEFFIKEFLAPKFPDKHAEISDHVREMQERECNSWFNKHSKVYKAIQESNSGNLVQPADFFSWNGFFYLVTDKVESNGLPFDQICRRTEEQRQMIMKILACELAQLAENQVVHFDLKPENLILKTTVKGFFTVKIIDFDGSFLTTDPPEPDDAVGDARYYSPEAIVYMTEEEGEITPKSDVFALGILFHEILCGQYPAYDKNLNDSVGGAVLNGDPVALFNQIPQEYRDLIAEMLRLDVTERPSAAEVLEQLREIEAGQKQKKPKPPVVPPVMPPVKREPKKPKEPQGKRVAPGSPWMQAPEL